MAQLSAASVSSSWEGISCATLQAYLILGILNIPYCIPHGICVYICYTGIYWYIQPLCVDPHISMAETGYWREHKRNTRKQSPPTDRKGWCSASVLSGIHWEVWWKSRNHLTFRFLCSFWFVFLCYRSTRVFSGQEGPCLCKSSAFFHYFSGLLALGSYYISFVSRWAEDSRSIVKSSDLSQGPLFQWQKYQQSCHHRASFQTLP